MNNRHFYAFLDSPYTNDNLYWIHTPMSRKEAFDWVKSKAKSLSYELILFDGDIYQYDHGSGKFIKQKWEHVVWEELS